MGKTNIFTLLATVVTQFVVGYLWYGAHLFGDVVTTVGGHAIDFLHLDVISLLLIVLSSYGLMTVLETLLTGVKDVGGSIRTGLTVGGFAVGLPIVMLMNLMGFSHITLLVVFTHLVLITILTSIIIVKMKKI